MSKTKELDRISSEIAKELEPKVFETISWGLTKTDLDNVEGDEFIELVTYIANKSLKKLIKNNAIGAASIHKNQTANPPRIAPKLFPLPPTITITQIKKVYLIGL